MVASVELAGESDDEVDVSVVTVIAGFDSRWWWLRALVAAELDAELLDTLLLADEDVLALFERRLLALLLVLLPLLLLALLLFRVARLVARADMRRFKSSRSNDFNGDTLRIPYEKLDQRQWHARKKKRTTVNCYEIDTENVKDSTHFD